jgi:hypothetical protein
LLDGYLAPSGAGKALRGGRSWSGVFGCSRSRLAVCCCSARACSGVPPLGRLQLVWRGRPTLRGRFSRDIHFPSVSTASRARAARTAWQWGTAQSSSPPAMAGIPGDGRPSRVALNTFSTASRARAPRTAGRWGTVQSSSPPATAGVPGGSRPSRVALHLSALSLARAHRTAGRSGTARQTTQSSSPPPTAGAPGRPRPSRAELPTSTASRA